MAYKGDSPGKAVTRYRLWMNMASTATAIGMSYRGSYVLGGEGGDISALLSLGIKPESITAVDFDKETTEKLKQKYPEVTVIHGEAGASAKNVQFNSVHLDFCGRINADNIITLADIQEEMGQGCVMITLLKGRETSKGTKKSKLWKGIHRRARRELLLKARKDKRQQKFDPCYLKLSEHLLSNKDGEDLNTKYIIEVLTERYIEVFKPGIGKKTHDEEIKGLNDSEVFIKKDGTPGPLGLGSIRIDALRFCAEILIDLRIIQKRITDRNYVSPIQGLGTQITSVVTYHSKTKKDHGTPFVSGLMWQADYHTIETKLRNPELMKRHTLYQHFNAKTSLEQLKAIILASPDWPAKYYAEMFKLKEGTIRAWRAHRTMNTYKDKVKPVINMSRATTQDSLRGSYCGWGRLYIDSNNRTNTILGDEDVIVRRTEDGSLLPMRESHSNQFNRVFNIGENGEGMEELRKYLEKSKNQNVTIKPY